LLLIALLAASHAAMAATHYTEVWNPPEARATQPHARALTHSARHARKLAKDHQVIAEPARLAKRAPAVLRPAAPTGKRVDIPPKLGPDGQVLWVRGDAQHNQYRLDGAAALVAHAGPMEARQRAADANPTNPTNPVAYLKV
jgi:hypothetical protein